MGRVYVSADNRSDRTARFTRAGARPKARHTLWHREAPGAAFTLVSRHASERGGRAAVTRVLHGDEVGEFVLVRGLSAPARDGHDERSPIRLSRPPRLTEAAPCRQ